MEDEYLRERGADVRQVIERVLCTCWPARPASAIRTRPSPAAATSRWSWWRTTSRPRTCCACAAGGSPAFVTDLGGRHLPHRHRGAQHGRAAPWWRAGQRARAGARRRHAGRGRRDRRGDRSILAAPSSMNYRERQRALCRRAGRTGAAARRARHYAGRHRHRRCTPISNCPTRPKPRCAAGAEGIGLFRSEFLFMGRPDLPGEEEQYQAYVIRGQGHGRPAR